MTVEDPRTGAGSKARRRQFDAAIATAGLLLALVSIVIAAISAVAASRSADATQQAIENEAVIRRIDGFDRCMSTIIAAQAQVAATLAVVAERTEDMQAPGFVVPRDPDREQGLVASALPLSGCILGSVVDASSQAAQELRFRGEDLLWAYAEMRAQPEPATLDEQNECIKTALIGYSHFLTTMIKYLPALQNRPGITVDDADSLWRGSNVITDASIIGTTEPYCKDELNGD